MRELCYLKKQDVQDKKSASISYFVCFLSPFDNDRNKTVFTQTQCSLSKAKCRQGATTKAAAINGRHVQNPAFCHLLTSQWSEKECAETPFPIPLELVPHN